MEVPLGRWNAGRPEPLFLSERCRQPRRPQARKRARPLPPPRHHGPSARFAAGRRLLHLGCDTAFSSVAPEERPSCLLISEL